MVIPWLILGLATNLFFGGSDLATVVTAALGMAHSVCGFLIHGGRRVSVAGVYLLSTGLFVYFPSIYLTVNPVMGALPYLLAAVNVCFFGQLAMYYFWWKPAHGVAIPHAVEVDPLSSRRAMKLGLTLVLLGLGAGLAGITHGLLDAAAFSGIVLYAVAAFRRPAPTMPYAYMIVAALFAAYYVFIFDGFGRLSVGALGIAVVASMAHRWPGRMVKVSLLAALVPGLLLLARARVELTAAMNPNQRRDLTGLESVLSPVGRFAQLLELDRASMLDHGHGGSFWASAVALVPRALWESKPIGFGSELTLIFRPHLAAVGHSEAATSYGEWLYNFGVWGLIFMIPAIAILVNVLDRVQVSVQGRPLTRVRDFLILAALIIAGAGMVDLVWGSSFSFMARGGSRILVLAGLYLGSAWLPRRRLRSSREDAELPRTNGLVVVHNVTAVQRREA